MALSPTPAYTHTAICLHSCPHLPSCPGSLLTCSKMSALSVSPHINTSFPFSSGPFPPQVNVLFFLLEHLSFPEHLSPVLVTLPPHCPFPGLPFLLEWSVRETHPCPQCPFLSSCLFSPSSIPVIISLPPLYPNCSSSKLENSAGRCSNFIVLGGSQHVTLPALGL